VLTFSDIRLLPPTYQGVSLSSSEIDGLTLQAGHLRSTHLRNEAGDGKLNAMLGHVPMRQAESDAFNYVGGDYAFNANLSSLSLWHGQLEDIYQQSFVGFKHSKPLGTGYSVPTWATSRPARMAMRCWGYRQPGVLFDVHRQAWRAQLRRRLPGHLRRQPVPTGVCQHQPAGQRSADL
jgi:hypothetical protein